MKKFISAALILSMAMAYAVIPASVSAAGETETITYNYNLEGGVYKKTSDHTRQMEKLDRGLVAIKSGSGVYLSWRLFDSEDKVYGSSDKNVTFNVYRDGTKITDEPRDVTNYTDTTAGTSYQVAPVIDGVEGDKCEAVSVYSNSYFDIDLTPPESETITTPSGETVGTFSFSPADCSTGDLDGDGEYEIIIKWTSSEHDVGSPGTGNASYSGTVRFAAYKLNGKKLWQNDINLGKNVYSSAHTVQFLVYDFNGDGKAEMMCQSSLGSTDGKGNYVSKASKDTTIAAITDEENRTTDYRPESGWGLITSGKEFLTVFNGETGEAIDTINFPTARGNSIDWGDANATSGNRVNRFTASVAYLDGKKPYAVYLRGYYMGKDNNGRQRCGISGTSFDGEKLSVDYRFDTKSGQPGYYEGAGIYVGQGNHNCTVADVDNDGKDEFITGALCMEVNDDNEFKPRWCTFMEHGDALHIGDYDPTHNGLEFFTIHEDSGPNTKSGQTVNIHFGMSVIDADSGEVLFHETNDNDTGRGIMANVGAGGYYQIYATAQHKDAPAGATKFAAGPYKVMGNGNYTEPLTASLSQNFRIFWDGDLYDELLDGTTTQDCPVGITSWDGSQMSRIFTTTGAVTVNGTKNNPCLQADILGDWREEIIAKADNNKLRVFMTTTPTDYKIKTLMQDPVYRSGVAAEQTAYNQPPHVGFYMDEEMFKNDITSLTITSEPTKKVYVIGEPLDTEGLVVKATYEDETEETVTSYNLSGYDSDSEGEKTITVEYKGMTATFKVKVLGIRQIELTSEPTKKEYVQGEQLDLSGMEVTATYSDDSTAVIDSSEYKISGYTPSQVGEQTVTVEYGGQTATFKVTVREASVEDLNGEYTNNSSTIIKISQKHIGAFTGAYVLEHTFTINTMPAAGNINDKGTVSGFTLRFMSDDTDTAKGGTGSGWTLVPNNAKTAADVYWKNSSNSGAARLTQNAPIKLGETYTVRYAFTDVATGNGARVNMYIIDSNGNTVMEQKDLDLRNFTFNDQKTSAINRIDITLQAASSDAPASVTIGDAKVTLCGVVYVDGKKVSVNLNNDSEVNSVRAYAVKYANGALTNVTDVTPKAPGELVSTLSFEPDKIYVWSNMMPLSLWSKSE